MAHDRIKNAAETIIFYVTQVKPEGRYPDFENQLSTETVDNFLINPPHGGRIAVR